MRTEIRRKSIHLACSVFPLAYYWFLSREQMLWLCGSITILFLSAELLRFNSQTFRSLFNRLFLPLLRESEIDKGITGATYLFIAMTLSVLAFGKIIAVPAVLFLTVADSLAAIVGKTRNSPKFLAKTVAGSCTFFLAATAIVIIFSPVSVIYAGITGLSVALIEALPLGINDNLLIPLSAGMIMFLTF